MVHSSLATFIGANLALSCAHHVWALPAVPLWVPVEDLVIVASPGLELINWGSMDATCWEMYDWCRNVVNRSTMSNVFDIDVCVFGASCFAPGVNSFIATLHEGVGTIPTSTQVPRVPNSLLSTIATNGQTISQQNYVDGYYRTITQHSGTFPANASIVINYFDALADWSGPCPATQPVSIPFKNFADYFEFSSTVTSNTCVTNDDIPPSSALPTSSPSPTSSNSSTSSAPSA